MGAVSVNRNGDWRRAGYTKAFRSSTRDNGVTRLESMVEIALSSVRNV